MSSISESTFKLLDQFNNEYAASMYVAKQARRLLILSNNALTESEAICWVVENRPISELDKYIKKKRAVLKERKYNLINEYATRIDDRELEKAFRSSAIKSNKLHKLTIQYTGLDYCQCTRLRILMKQYWLDHQKFELQDKPLRNFVSSK